MKCQNAADSSKNGAGEGGYEILATIVQPVGWRHQDSLHRGKERVKSATFFRTDLHINSHNTPIRFRTLDIGRVLSSTSPASILEPPYSSMFLDVNRQPPLAGVRSLLFTRQRVHPVRLPSPSRSRESFLRRLLESSAVMVSLPICIHWNERSSNVGSYVRS